MTRKEAAGIVREVKKNLKESADEQLENIGPVLTPDMLTVVGNYFERQYEALDMAIEALYDTERGNNGFGSTGR